MKTTLFKNLTLASAIMLLAVSCGEFGEEAATPENKKDFTDGTPVEVEVSLRIANEQSADGSVIPLTRAPLDTDQDAIHNVWVFQFNGTGDDATLVCPYFYIDDDTMAAAGGVGPVAMPLIDSKGAEHRLVFIANINGAYNWSLELGAGTYADLKSRWINLTNEAPTYGAERKNLIMVGTAVTPVNPNVLVDGDDIYTTDVGPGVAMTRSLACVELDLRVAAAGFRVISVQLKDVSKRFDLFDAQLGITGNYPAVATTFDYEAEVDTTDDGLVKTGGQRWFRWFVPRNTRGTGTGSTSALTKNSYAIKGATFFEILAEDAAGKGVLFRVYPGANDVDDFNIVPNHKYTLTLNITGNGGPNVVDSRIESYGDVMFTGFSNSFLLNPPPAGSAREFSIPVSQVNRYWLPAHAGYGGMNSNRIENTDDWTVYLLWQDAQDMVRPVATAGADHVTITKSTGTGGSDYFTVRVPSGATHGNFTVVIRKDDPGDTEILWSWHLWVTDYNPDPRFIAIRGDQFIYSVPNGQVERYYGIRFGYSSDTSSDAGLTSYNPAVTATATLAQSVVMDRYLGAISTANPSAGRGALYYQWGRKDPFPGKIDLYDIDGGSLPTTAATAPAAFPEQYWTASNANMASARPLTTQDVQIKDAIRNPMVFYGSNTWVGISSTSAGWNDPQSTNPAYYNTKSIYDPCPEGWRLTPTRTMADFKNGVNVNAASRGLGYANGLRYYPYIMENGIDYSATEYAYYPLQGFRASDSGAISVSRWGNWWTATPSTTTYGIRYQFDSSVVYHDSGNAEVNRSVAANVRCASE